MGAESGVFFLFGHLIICYSIVRLGCGCCGNKHATVISDIPTDTSNDMSSSNSSSSSSKGGGNLNLTVLRVQRCIGNNTNTPADTLRVPSIDDDTAVFRRVCLDDGFILAATHDISHDGRGPTDRKRKVQLVDAQMGDLDEAEAEISNKNNKRIKRSLQVLRTQTLSSEQFRNLAGAPTTAASRTVEPHTRKVSSSSSSLSLRQRMKQRAAQKCAHHPTAVWDPLLRQVDLSLAHLFSKAAVAASSKQQLDNEDETRFIQHLQMIQINTPNVNHFRLSHYLNWACSNGQGTFLHALVQNKAMDTLCHFMSLYSHLIDITVTNSHGQTAEHVSGDSYEQICDIFVAYRAEQQQQLIVGTTTTTQQTQSLDMKTEYDYYVLEASQRRHGSNTWQDEGLSHFYTCAPNPISDAESFDNTRELELELTGACAYWKDTGELVLELNDPTEEDPDASNNGSDSDSNHENWIGNDYPDDDESQDCYYQDYDDDEYDEDRDRMTYAYDSDWDGDHDD